MNYYKLGYSVEIKEIGFFEPLRIIPPYNINEPYSYYKAPGCGYGLIDYDIRFPKFSLASRAKIRDFLFIASGDDFTVVSKKFYDLLCQFNVGPIQSYQIQVKWHTKEYEFYAVYFPFRGEVDYLDWNLTNFRKVVGYSVSQEELKFSNHTELLDYKRANFHNDITAIPDRLILNEEKIDVDIFKIGLSPNYRGLYISERLKNAIEENGIKGCRIQTIDE